MLDTLTSDFPEHTPRPAQAPRALEGLRVVDFTHFIAGPFATMILADMGADVIKVESPGRGDEYRHFAPVPPQMPDAGGPFVWSNRNKRSVALDLKNPAAQKIVRELIAGADVVAENFSTGVMAKFGLDYESCKAINPKLVYCTVSAYGRDGPFADRLGFDPVTQAESGFTSMNGYPDRPGVRTLSPVMDISTAMMVSNVILGALLARSRTGQGQLVEAALFDTAVQMTGYAAMQSLYSGNDPQRHGNTSVDTCPSGVFQASDAPFYITVGNDKIFNRLAAQVVERPDLAADPTLANRNGRLVRKDELFDLLGKAFAQQPRAHWMAKLRAASIPAGEVRTVGQALRSPEARARGLVTRIAQPDVGWLPNIALPVRMHGTPLADPLPAPRVGQHTDEVLRGTLGYDDAAMAAATRAGAFGAAGDKT
jgi:crotonobetainyl-CoA:carnitine CoA-transferase CaiB-like acyl-CoA transferase